MEPPIGRPKGGCLSTFESSVKEKIDQYRPGTSGWSALTIQVELNLAADLEAYCKPSRSSINRYLKSKNRTMPRQKQVPLPVATHVLAMAPHSVWQMDARGNEPVKGLGSVVMINIKDVFSKVLVANYPCVFAKSTNHPQRSHYQQALRLGWMEFGVNEVLQVDHESIYYDNKSASPYPTNFHLWATGLNIELVFTPLGKPQQQGMVEKSHQTVHTQVLAGRQYQHIEDLLFACGQRRQRLNYDIPSSSTDKLPPLVNYPQAQYSGRPYDPAQEEQMFNLELVYDLLAKGKWYRRVASSKTITLGGKVYYLSVAKPHTEITITFDRLTKLFRFCTADDKLIAQLEPIDLSFKELAGDLEEFIHWGQKTPYFLPSKPDTTF